MIENTFAYFLSLLGITMSYYFYLKGKTKKVISFVYVNTNLQSKNHPSIKIYYNNKEGENLNRLVIAFFNNGNLEVSNNDIPKNKPPLILLKPQHNIVSYNILTSTDSSNKIVVKKITNNTLQLSFDYLNSFDGCLLEVIYEGKVIDKDIVKIDTKLIGRHKIIQTQYERTPSKKEIVESSIIFGALFLFTVFLLFSFIADIQYYKLVTIILIYIFSYLVFKKKYYNRIYISKRMPKLLREYKYA